MTEQKIEEQRDEDIRSVLAMLSGIEDEKAREIENYIKEYLLGVRGLGRGSD